MIEHRSRHGLLDLYGCSPELLSDEEALSSVLHGAAEAAGATILFTRFHTFGGHGGVTGVLLLAESHISIHTWPEWEFAAVDIFVCGHLRLEAARRVLQEMMNAKHILWQEIPRGIE